MSHVLSNGYNFIDEVITIQGEKGTVSRASLSTWIQCWKKLELFSFSHSLQAK